MTTLNANANRTADSMPTTCVDDGNGGLMQQAAIVKPIPAGSNNIGSVTLSGSLSLVGKVQNVTTAGTRVQLPDYACREVTLIAKRGNTGHIYVGGSDVSNSVYGAELIALESITLQVSNTNLIYIDASVNGEGISYVTI